MTNFDQWLNVLNSGALSIGTFLSTRPMNDRHSTTVRTAVLATCALVIVATNVLSVSRRDFAADTFHSGALTFWVIGAGVLLFAVKHQSLFIFGLTQVVAALGGAIGVALVDQGGNLARMTAAVAATFFLARGLDDAAKGWRQRQMSKPA